MKCLFEITPSTAGHLVNLCSGLFYPLTGFMTRADYTSVLTRMELASGQVWTIPITLDVDVETFRRATQSDRLYLSLAGQVLGFIEIQDCFEVDPKTDAATLFGTDNRAHPGVQRELNRSIYRIGGRTALASTKVPKEFLHPDQMRGILARRGWQTVAGFQTRNPIHRGHEHLQRIALEVCDGLFINPLLGWRTAGEFSDAAIRAAYIVMITEFYPPAHVHLAGLRTVMWYAGPREAIFHALVRRNLGCTHFIIGRDHAGVGRFYEKYAAHDLARKLAARHDLGITCLLLREPFFCVRCSEVVSDHTCGHPAEDHLEISGSSIRDVFRRGAVPDERFMRREIASAIAALDGNKFIHERTL